MAWKQFLTNEALRKQFPNNFNLAEYAIQLSRYYVKSGHEMSIDEILEEILRHPNPSYLEDLKLADVEESHG